MTGRGVGQAEITLGMVPLPEGLAVQQPAPQGGPGGFVGRPQPQIFNPVPIPQVGPCHRSDLLTLVQHCHSAGGPGPQTQQLECESDVRAAVYPPQRLHPVQTDFTASSQWSADLLCAGITQPSGSARVGPAGVCRSPCGTGVIRSSRGLQGGFGGGGDPGFALQQQQPPYGYDDMGGGGGGFGPGPQQPQGFMEILPPYSGGGPGYEQHGVSMDVVQPDVPMPQVGRLVLLAGPGARGLRGAQGCALSGCSQAGTAARESFTLSTAAHGLCRLQPGTVPSWRRWLKRCHV